MPKESGETSADFRFCDSAKAFREKINQNSSSDNLGPQIHLYWLCAQLGLIASNKDAKLPNGAGVGTEMSDEFVGMTRDYQVRIRSFLMYRYLIGMGFEKDELNEEDANQIETAMDGFLQTSGSHLKTKGVRLLDQYAQKGWDIIVEKGINNLNDLSTFLYKYIELIKEYSD